MSFKDKLTLETDFFYEYRSNILMTRESIPPTMGLSAPVRANVGEASSQGVDGSIIYADQRSEEHTSELQSLMRISYAVLCLKKKKQKSERTYRKVRNYQSQTRVISINEITNVDRQ